MGEGLEGGLRPMERMLEIPVSILPTEAIRAMRIVGESRGWEMGRFEETTLVQRWAIMVPIAKRGRVLGLKVLAGEAEGLAIRTRRAFQAGRHPTPQPTPHAELPYAWVQRARHS